jgi:chromosome segregation ATPase
MSKEKPLPSPSANGATPPPTENHLATGDDLMKALVRQHRIINNLKDQIANLMLGLAENQASMDEVREELNQARSELARIHEDSVLAGLEESPTGP